MKKMFTLASSPGRDGQHSVLCRMDAIDPHDIYLLTHCEKARLSDLVPVARNIGDMVIRNVRRQLRLAGQTVPCRKGCAECCKYLVPVSTPEAVHITEDILALPTPIRKQILTSLVKAAKIVLASPSFSYSTDGLSLWYSDLDIICPMLKEAACRLYPARPIACREHLVIGSSCIKGQDAKVADIPLSVVRALADVAAELEGTQPEAVILPLAPAWYESNSIRAMRTWPATMLAERFAAALLQQQTTRAAAR